MSSAEPGGRGALGAQTVLRYKGGRLRNVRADVEDQQRGQRADHEQRAPSQARRDVKNVDEVEDAEERECSEQIPNHVSLLQDAAEEAAPFGRQHLHRHCGAQAPFAAHGHAVQRAKYQKDRKIG